MDILPFPLLSGHGQGRAAAARQPLAGDEPVDPLEIVEIGEVDRHLAPLGAHVDAHAGVEAVGEQLLQLEQAGRPQAGRCHRVRGPVDRGRRTLTGRRGQHSPAAHRFLDDPHRPSLRRGPAGEALLERPIRGPEQRPGVTGGQPAVGEQVLDRGRQTEQAQRVRDRRPALAHPPGDLVVGQLEVLDQLLEGRRLLERGEIVPVQVLDQRLLDRADVVGVAHDRRHGGETGSLGGAPAPLAGDQLEPAVDGAERGPVGARRAGRSTRRARSATPRRSAPAVGGGSG